MAIISAWHTDADLGRPIEVVTDMSKSRKLGFLDYQPTDDSFFDLFARLRAARIIPLSRLPTAPWRASRAGSRPSWHRPATRGIAPKLLRM